MHHDYRDFFHIMQNKLWLQHISTSIHISYIYIIIYNLQISLELDIIETFEPKERRIFFQVHVIAKTLVKKLVTSPFKLFNMTEYR